MPDHIYSKEELIQRFDSILGKTFEEIDDIGMFEHVQEFNLQKGVAGSVVEQCVLRYPPDSKQEADLIVVEGGHEISTELKTTGMVIKDGRFVAKEPMSITAVGVYELADQSFEKSHFWDKLEHMLIVYYHYMSDKPVSPFEYRLFPVKGYEFHEFSEVEIETLKNDWKYVYSLVKRVVDNHPGEHNAEWKEAVKQEYIDTHGELRRVLSYIDLAPKFPPRFRLKKPVVSTMISQHFGYELEQLPGRYTSVSDIDAKCREITNKYKGKTVKELGEIFGIETSTENGSEKKGITEQIIISMFGGTSKKLNQIELFEKFGLIGKTIVTSSTGGRTEDMKLFHVDFDEFIRTEIMDENGVLRPFEFEDSELYSYFSEHEFLCIIFQEPEEWVETFSGPDYRILGASNSLNRNKFIGFKRLVFDEDFINSTVKKLWIDVRDKIMNNKLVDVVTYDKNGNPKRNNSGDISSAPNFMKSSQNTVFMRGSGTDSAMIHKTECVNGIKMLPQYVWIKGCAVVDELKKVMQI